MFINKKLTLILLFVAAVGICTGAFFEVYMEGSGKEQLMGLLSAFLSGEGSQSFAILFFTSMKKWLLLTALLFFLPLIPPLALLSPLFPLLKGLALGFSATMLVETFGVRGGWYIISTMLPHSLIQIPALCMMAAASMELAFLLSGHFLSKKRRNPKKNALQNYARQYVLCYGVGLAALVISCLIESLLM